MKTTLVDLTLQHVRGVLNATRLLCFVIGILPTPGSYIGVTVLFNPEEMIFVWVFYIPAPALIFVDFMEFLLVCSTNRVVGISPFSFELWELFVYGPVDVFFLKACNDPLGSHCLKTLKILVSLERLELCSKLDYNDLLDD